MHSTGFNMTEYTGWSNRDTEGAALLYAVIYGWGTERQMTRTKFITLLVFVADIYIKRWSERRALIR